MIRGKEAAEKWSKVLDLPEEQALPCVVAFACLRYHGKSFATHQEIRVKDGDLA